MDATFSSKFKLNHLNVCMRIFMHSLISPALTNSPVVRAQKVKVEWAYFSLGSFTKRVGSNASRTYLRVTSV